MIVLLVEEAELLRGDDGQGSAAGNGLDADVLSELGGVALETLALQATADLHGADTHLAGVDGATDAPLGLDIDLGEVEVLRVKCKVVFDVSLGGPVDHRAHLEALDRLVLGHPCSDSNEIHPNSSHITSCNLHFALKTEHLLYHQKRVCQLLGYLLSSPLYALQFRLEYEQE